MGHELKLCLASASPRRQELLRQIGVEFDVIVSQIDEQNLPGEKPVDYVLRVARDKAVEVRRRRQASHLSPLPVLGADTCVTLDGIILGKPRDREDGEGMLRRLSGRTHDVVSAIVLLCGEVEDSAINTSQVTFGPLTDKEISQYWDTGEPADKAGGYAIQGQAAAFIQHIAGSYSGIVGLPLYELVQVLKDNGILRE